MIVPTDSLMQNESESLEIYKGVVLDDNAEEEPGTVVGPSKEENFLHFCLFDPIADFLPPLSEVSNLQWEGLVTRNGHNTLYMTFPFCHGKLMHKLGEAHAAIHAYDFWLLNEVTNVYEPIAIWIKRECNARQWILDSFDFWFQKGEGMIGKVGAREKWEANKQKALGEDDTFLRQSLARKSGLQRGDAIWFPFNSHRFVIGFYTRNSWIDESIRLSILEGSDGSSQFHNSSVEEASPMQIEDDTAPSQRICLEEL